MKRKLMKKIVFVLFGVLICLFNLKSQDSLSRTQIGFDFCLGNNALGRGNIYPSITLSKNKHLIFIGPALIYGMDYNPYPPQYGLQAGYQWYPNGKKNRFNLFFEYDFNFVNAKFEDDYFDYYSKTLQKQNINITSVDNYLGFGFRLNIAKGLYFKTNLGLGLIFYKEKINWINNSGNLNSYEYDSGWHFGNFYPFGAQKAYGGFEEYNPISKRFIGIIKVGLGWDLYSIKKKRNLN